MSLAGFTSQRLKNPFPGQPNVLARQPQHSYENELELPMQVRVNVRGSWVTGFIIGIVAGALNRTGMDCHYQVEITGPDGRKQSGLFPQRDIRSLFD